MLHLKFKKQLLFPVLFLLLIISFICIVSVNLQTAQAETNNSKVKLEEIYIEKNPLKQNIK